MSNQNPFIAPDIELRLYQDSQSGTGYESCEIAQSAQRLSSCMDSFDVALDSVVSLERMRDFISSRDVDRTAAILFNIASEGYGNYDQINDPKVAFALESISEGYCSQKDKEVAIENIAYNIAGAVVKLSNAFNSSMMVIGDLFHSFDRNVKRLKSRVAQLQTLHSDIAHDSQPVYNYVKPENNFTHLMYTDSGFSKGLSPVLHDVRWLFSQHSEKLLSTIDGYKNWYRSNKDNLDDISAFSDLRYDPQDFIFEGCKLFSSSVGNKTPSKGSVFFRTRELPGGQSQYIELPNLKLRGVDSIDSISKVRYFIDYWQPNSFKMLEKSVYGAAALGAMVWASVMMANPLPLVFSGFVHSTISEKTKTQDLKKVRINESTVFTVLDKDSIGAAIEDIKNAIDAMEDWHQSIVRHTWRDQDIKAILNDFSKVIKEEGFKSGNFNHYRNFIAAIISITSRSYAPLHRYGYDTVNSSIGYVDKCIRQYK